MIYLVVYIAEGIGFLLLAGIIVTGNSILPRWAVLASPLFLMLLKPLVVRLPKGVRVIVSGGWSNLISVIYNPEIYAFSNYWLSINTSTRSQPSFS